jgi:phage FluMu gp28-like protein
MVDAPVLRFEGTVEFNDWPEPMREAEIRDWCEEHLKPHLVALEPHLLHVIGEDFGRSGDLTVLAPMAITQQLRRVIPFLIELRNVPFRQQEQILYYVCDRLPRFLAGALDARGNGQYLAEQAKYRYGSGRIEEVMLSQGWYLENMPKLKAAFEDDLISLPRDADVLNDLRALQVIKGIPRLPEGKTDSGKKRHGDAAIAIAMAWFASQMDVQEYNYIPVNKASQDDADRVIRTTAGFRNSGGCW